MIRLILGGVGSGKSLLATKYALKRDNHLFLNYKIRTPNNTRIKVQHIIDSADKKPHVNWDYWNAAVKKHGGFDIIIDEIHNVMHARRAMSRQNVIMSQWISQIRKVTGDNEHYDFLCISQAFERIDVAVRDLAYEIIICKKVELTQNVMTTIYKNGKKMVVALPVTLIFLTYFTGDNCKDNYMIWKATKNKRFVSKQSYFYANPYFKFYDSYELLSFGEDEYL